MEKMNRAMEKMKILVGMEEEVVEEESSFAFLDELNQNCTLSYQQINEIRIRMIWHIIICAEALRFCHMLGFWRCLYTFVDASLLQSNQVWYHVLIWQFACNWKLLSWSLLYDSTAFLIGPKRQVTMMLDPVRIYATAIYLASIIMSLFCALYVHNKLLTLLAILLEFSALVWYSLSYIPFARSMVSKVMVACFDTEF